MTISDILQAKWLIHKDVALSYLPPLLSYINGNKEAFFNIEADFNLRNKPYALQGPVNIVDRWELTDTSVPDGSVAVIPLDGPIYAWRSMNLVEYIRQANENDRIVAIVLVVNSPGGMVFFTDIAAKAIGASKKPVVSFVLQMACSAGMWLISASKRIIISSELDMLGSIGVMVSVMDMTRLLRDKLGIDVYEIYASKSTRKNEFMRLLQDPAVKLEDKTKPIIEHLDFTNDVFHKAIQDNLGISPDSEIFTGAVYYAAQAISLGLAHEINSFEYALEHARSLGYKQQIKSFF
jgi:ClpP class serine protease